MSIITLNNRATNRSDTASAGQVFTATSATAADFQVVAPGGITMADAWRVSANATFNGSADITSNWERTDTDSYGTIGSAMAQSSGIFTFPATGIYLVLSQLMALPDGVRQYVGHRFNVTANNSSYSIASESMQHATATNNYICSNSSFIVDVTNTSNVKVKLAYGSNGSASVLGNTAETYTGMTFIRLGNT